MHSCCPNHTGVHACLCLSRWKPDHQNTWIKCTNNVTQEVFGGQYAVLDGYGLTTKDKHPKAIDGHHYGDCHVKTRGQGWPGQGIRDAIVNMAFNAVCKHSSAFDTAAIPSRPAPGSASPMRCPKGEL